MSGSGGVFAVDRGVFDHPFFADEPFTEREAWLWLISEAAWKPLRKRMGKSVVDLKCGQAAVSVRFLAEAWRWHRSRVERYLGRLKAETMIETHTETGVTVVTICNYSKYQRVSLPSETLTETDGETPPRHLRDTKSRHLKGTKSPQISSVNGASHDGERDTSEEPNRDKLEDIESPSSLRSEGRASGSPPENGFDQTTRSPSEVLFDGARRWLIKASGKPDEKARSLLGKWRKLCGGDDTLLLEILREAKQETIGDPTGWVERAIKLRTKNRPAEPSWGGTPIAIWRLNVEGFRKHRVWTTALGGEPGTSGYRGPPELLDEFGFATAKMA